MRVHLGRFPVVLALASCGVDPSVTTPAAVDASTFESEAFEQPATRLAEMSEVGWSQVVQQRISAGEYRPYAEGAAFRLNNPQQDYTAWLDSEGLVLAPQGKAQRVELQLSAWGREGALRDVTAVEPQEGLCVRSGAVDAMGECIRGVEYAHEGLTEWWENDPAGIEQGFTVDAFPEGDGPLVFELAVSGAQSQVISPDEALLTLDSGEVIHYRDLLAWDETGQTLPAWMEETDAGLRLVVDDALAQGQVTVDPWLTQIWTVESNGGTAYYGYSLASAGDVNNDGYADIIVGAYGYDDGGSTDEGRVWAYYGGANGPSTTADWMKEPSYNDCFFGWSVGTAGDVNNDGYDDVIIGAPHDENNLSYEGLAYVFHGSATGLGTSYAWRGEGDQSTSFYGSSVSAAGDVNNDGYDDVIVGASTYDNGQADEGRAFVYLGSSLGLANTAVWTSETNQAGAYFGCEVSGVGDVNNDGYDEVAVGAWHHTNGQTYEGGAFVYLGVKGRLN